MTEQEQRIVIAEACGWKREVKQGRSPGYELTYWTGPDGRDYGIHPILPDYLHDLNAMHEAEKLFYRDARERYRFAQNLAEICRNDESYSTYGRDIWHATAAQRAEAFLRTIGKWKDQ